MKSCVDVLRALNLIVSAVGKENLATQRKDDRAGWLPVSIRLTGYLQLKELGWYMLGLDCFLLVEVVWWF